MTDYQIDTAHTAAQFKVRHLMISNVKGEFTHVTGTVSTDPANPSATQIDATIDATTISTRSADRDTHLKSADFLDVEKYPTISFHSTSVTSTGPDSFDATGDLTIRDVTRPATLTVEEVTAEVKDPWGSQRIGATAKTKISRQEFGLTWNAALETGGVMVGDEIDITIDVELVRS